MTGVKPVAVCIDGKSVNEENNDENKDVAVFALQISRSLNQGLTCDLGFVCHVKPHSFRLSPQRWWSTSSRPAH